MSQSGIARVSSNNLPPSVATSYVTNSGTAVPSANTLNILGMTVPAGTTPFQFVGSGNTVTGEIQFAQASASSNPNLAGILSLNSAQFTVDANGYASFTGSGEIVTLTGNNAIAISPSAGNINTVGVGSITIIGSGNTLTTQLTGLTDHAVLVGNGSTSITNVGPSMTSGQVLQSRGLLIDPAFSTATYPSTTTINQILYSSSANVVGGLTTANNGVLTTGTTGIPVITALGTDGQVIIGSSAGAPAAATLSAGTGITITNGNNTITIAATGSEIVWTDEAVSFNAVAGNGYFITAGSVVATLPGSPTQGQTIDFAVDTTSSFEILANTGQVIRIGTAVSASAGNATSNARGDSVTLVYRSSDTAWIATSVIGTWTVT